jgi:GntR family transcriptional regulator
MAEEFSISRITVRKALDGLVSEGLLTRRQGAGTFVAARVEKSFSKLSSFTEDMISRGRTPRSEWISKAEGSVTPEESLTLGLSPGTPVYRFARIRYADGAPMAVEYSTVAGFALPSAEVVGPRSTRRWKPPATAPPAPCSGCARCCSPPNRPTCWACRSRTPAC